MKNILIVISFLLLSFNSNKVVTYQVSMTYPGTWHYDNGNQRFIVKIWEENNSYLGHYKMIQLNDGVAVGTIYDSRMLYPNGARLPYTIYTKNSGFSGLSGFIHDNTIVGNDVDYKTGNLGIKINTSSGGCQTCPITATWKIAPTQGIIVGTDLPFSVPTDITLTKVSNAVVWD